MSAAFDTHGAVELILLEVAGADFCIDIRSVREIRGFTASTPLPQAPDFVLGVINLRGAVMPVLDLRARLGLGKTEASGRHVIVVVHHEDRPAGLLVDAVQETMILPMDQLQPPPRYDNGPGEAFVDALIPLEGRILSRLHVPSLLPLEVLEAA
ncbi:MAG: chemotaxis protein CheW [Phenylobacterium sp. RIFCSPHIGHO2_01_FULL_69_31]|uniref:chemotaxis protein CheW n=1 Tax=Phenylobacterium sp. RIFCSPHIGHO2_01_FULL_69_31 TaxID=1801944 RepID=UPI0008C7323A|nr:chemotaxis protein CheW [Phenylobacterium sp. RIFCSPHIGHO2_01_FULL_69_31]OHB30080.1 MAG: chemotaxis protein CheW [Phenylobacterium sp. RIFCSPHIGHO2_01_FULL_69_31]